MDVTETGTTLRQNQLKIVDIVMESSGHLIANKKSLKDKQKRQKIFDIVIAAIMIENDIGQILTFNSKDFSITNELETLNPLEIL